MATIVKQVSVPLAPDRVWDAVRDFPAVHERFAPGFVVTCDMDGADRLITFANGMRAREVLISIDDAARRMAYSARSERIGHHNGSFVVAPEGAGSRITWTIDILPNEIAPVTSGMMDDGCKAMHRAFG